MMAVRRLSTQAMRLTSTATRESSNSKVRGWSV